MRVLHEQLIALATGSGSGAGQRRLAAPGVEMRPFGARGRAILIVGDASGGNALEANASQQAIRLHQGGFPIGLLIRPSACVEKESHSWN